MNNLFKVKEKHKGSAAVETVILFPLMFFMLSIILYLFFVVLSYVSYNNLANSIAKELDMRVKGYSNVYNNYASIPNDININESQIISDNEYLRRGTYFALDKILNQDLFIPYSEIDNIRIYTDRGFHPDMGEAASGILITVEINYKAFLGFEIPIRAAGYNIII